MSISAARSDTAAWPYLERYRGYINEATTLTAMLITLGVYYMVPNFPVRLAGLFIFFALSVYRPALNLAIVPLAAPLFYRQPLIAGLYFPLAEVVIACGVGAWILRDGWTLLRTRRLPWLREMLGQPAVWLALGLTIIGVLWLFVPPGGDLRKFALREFRWTVLEPVLFFAMMLRWLRTERDIWRMVAAWLIAAALVGREGAEQFLFGDTWQMEGVGRVSSVYPSATALGIYLGKALALSLVLASVLPTEWKRWRLAVAALSVPIGLGLLFSFARGAWIGVFVALVVAAIIARRRILWAGISAAVALGLAALPFVRVDRITSTFDFSTEDNTGVARAKIWSASLRILGDHPFTGIGQDQLLYQDPAYGIPQLRFFQTSHPHNWILDFWLRLGLPGLAWVVAALAYFFWQAYRLWQQHAGTALGALTLGLMASMVDFAVHGLLDMAYFTMDNALTFWLTVGLIVLVKRYVSLEHQIKHELR